MVVYLLTLSYKRLVYIIRLSSKKKNMREKEREREREKKRKSSIVQTP